MEVLKTSCDNKTAYIAYVLVVNINLKGFKQMT